jgi:hypothetical protein
MKKALLNSFLFSFLTFAAFSQAFVINSPASLAGPYLFDTAQFGALFSAEVICGDLVLGQPNNGCDPSLSNPTEVAGKIVCIDRGSCEFGWKALRGEEAGAIACIIFNNVAGAGVQRMGAGAVGGSVTIPAIMLSYEDGLKIKAAIAAGETINACMGNIKFPNDLSTNSRAAACHAPFGTYPASWLRNADDFVITPGANITNRGVNLGSGVKLNAKIAFTPNGGTSTQFYDKTSDLGIFIEVDSTNRITLDPIDILGLAKGQGHGTISYKVSSDSTETSIADNSAVSDFYISTNIFCKARLAANGRDPFVTANYRRTDGTNAEYISFYTIPYCKDCKIDTILFSMAVSSPLTLAGLQPEASLYGWFDANQDGDATNDELSYLATGLVTFDGADARTQAIVRVPLQDFNTGGDGFIIPEDNFGICVGVRYGGAESVFFGFDEGMDYLCDNELKTNAGTLRIDDLPYLGVTGYDPNLGVPDVDNAAFRFTGLSAPLAASMILSGSQFGTVSSKQLSDSDVQMGLFPNPAKDKMSVDIRLKEETSKLVYNVLDNTGKIIFQSADKNPGKEFKARFNVQELANGLYHLLIRTDNGFKQASFEVMK